LAQPEDGLVARCDLPVLELFNPTPGDALLPGAYLISGLALDPMAQQGASGVDQVSFFLGSRDQGGAPLGSVAPSGGARGADFSLSLDLPGADTARQQQLVAYARSSITGKETELSLPVVIGVKGTRTDRLNVTGDDTINTNPGTLPMTCSPEVQNLSASAASGTQTALQSFAPGAGASELFGTVVGSVSSCHNGVESPITLASVQAQGTNASAQTDLLGGFVLTAIPAPGTYTISASDGGGAATRMYVPVAPGETIDVGTLQIGADVSGCGEDAPSP